MRPSIDEVQTVLGQAGKVIMSVSKGVATWRKADRRKRKDGKKKISEQAITEASAEKEGAVKEPPAAAKKERLYTAKREEKPVIIEKPSNYFKLVSESKEVTKMFSMLSGCMQVWSLL